MEILTFYFNCYGFVKIYNHSSAAYIASKIVKSLNANPDFPAIAFLDGNAICQKPFELEKNER